jgi:hypothetical protein
MYDIKFVGYSGFVVPLQHRVVRMAAQQFCHSFVNRRRDAGYHVSYLGRGEWEIQNETAAMIGYLVVRPTMNGS